MSDKVVAITESDQAIKEAVDKLNEVLAGMDLQIAVPAVLTITETALRHIESKHAINYLNSAADLLKQEQEEANEE